MGSLGVHQAFIQRSVLVPREQQHVAYLLFAEAALDHAMRQGRGVLREPVLAPLGGFLALLLDDAVSAFNGRGASAPGGAYIDSSCLALSGIRLGSLGALGPAWAAWARPGQPRLRTGRSGLGRGQPLARPRAGPHTRGEARRVA